jgi:DMSO/TMAO reductase YedYZ molybdopterin-dependent catalytic subunit
MDERTIGRAAFLGVVTAGIAGLFVGRDAMRVAGRLVPDSIEAAVPSSGWRIYTIGNAIPRIDPAAYRLSITGAVERPVTYGLDDLRAIPRARQVSDFHCVTGWSVYDVHWSGIRFSDLLAEAGLRPEAKALRFVSDEVPYDDTLSLAQAFAPDAMLALGLGARSRRSTPTTGAGCGAGRLRRAASTLGRS